LEYLTSDAHCLYGNFEPFSNWNIAIDGGSNSWFISITNGQPYCMVMIPNLVNASATALGNGAWGAALEVGDSYNIYPMSAVAIDGEGNAWASTGYGLLLGFSSTNATMDYTSSSASTVLLTPEWSSNAGYAPDDPSANAGGRTTGATYALLGGGYPLDGSGLSGSNNSTGFTSLGVDGSGNLWVSGKAIGWTTAKAAQGSQLTEFIGLTAPAQTPLASSLTNSANNKGGLGARP